MSISWVVDKEDVVHIYKWDTNQPQKEWHNANWTARRSNKSILKEISPEYSLEGLMLRLKLQYFGHLMQNADSLEKTPCWERLKSVGKGDNRGRYGRMASPTQWTWVWVNSGSWWWTGKPSVLQSMGVTKSQTWLSNWTELIIWRDPREGTK